MKTTRPKIIWTKVDEAPQLASYSFLPALKKILSSAGIDIETKDISLAGRILAHFPDFLQPGQRIPDALAELGELTRKKEANIIKLPNISASVPQLQAAINELQDKGFNVPAYPEEPRNEEEKKIKERYAKVLGSAVNPVLRQGNSDRRAAESVKRFAQKNPHTLMKPWPQNSKTHVAHMKEGDYYENEKSLTLNQETEFKIVLETNSGKTIVLKDHLHGEKGEIIDATFMSKDKLREFYRQQIRDAKDNDLLLSLHLKATMMKVSDPIMFGHAVREYYKDVLEKYRDDLEKIGFNPNYGIADLYKKLERLPEEKQKEIKKAVEAVYSEQPRLAMVDSGKGITNLHVPNNIIIDASMPVVIRDGGQMWGPDGQLHDTKAMIPDRTYARMYQKVIEDAQKHGQFDPATMGTVQNVGLMAMKAEEYGSHPTTFEIPEDGTVKVVDSRGNVLMSHHVKKGDIWRMSRTKDIAVKDWVKLAIKRGKITGYPVVFWLDENRAHDRELIRKVNEYLKDHDTTGLEIRIMAPEKAMAYTLDRIRKGQNTIAVTGNVLRDYLTDLFPILELGTSARMLSIVPLLAGGGLFETGAGGSAPKHVQQFVKEGHLRWDSLGEFLALTASLEHLAGTYNNKKARILAETLDKAIEKYLENRRSPGRKVGDLDTRGAHYFLIRYWAEELANQTEDTELAEKYKTIAQRLIENEEQILEEIRRSEGKPKDIGGYYLPDDQKAGKAMRPSETLNKIVESI